MRSSAGWSAKREAVASTAAISSGARIGSNSSGKQQFAHARVRRDRGKNGAGDRPARSCPSAAQSRAGPRCPPAKYCKERRTRERESLPTTARKMKFASIFPSTIAKLRNGRHAERVQRVVRLLARERRMQHQRTGEKKRDPEQAGAVAAGFGGRGIKGEAEKHDDDQGEDDVALSNSRVRNSRRSSLASKIAAARAVVISAGLGTQRGEQRPRVAARAAIALDAAVSRAKRRAWRDRAIRCARACSSSRCSRSSRRRCESLRRTTRGPGGRGRRRAHRAATSAARAARRAAIARRWRMPRENVRTMLPARDARPQDSSDLRNARGNIV